MNWKVLLVAGLLTYGAYQTWQTRAVSYGARVVAPLAPQQQELDHREQLSALSNLRGYQITPLARFNIEARLLASKSYSLGREADLSPVDFALGWGRMSDEAILNKIDISQSGRFYFWRTDAFPIPRDEIETHSANMHMIPADADVERALKSARVGQIVRIDGYLIEVRADDGWHWKSSLSRSDTGNGACEVVLVKSVYIR